MKKFELQMFAEEIENESGSDESVADDKGSEQKEPEKKYSDDDVDRIVNAKFKKWKEEEQRKIDEAEKLAQMNERQKIEYERDKLQSELDALKAKDAKNSMKKEASRTIREAGVTISDEMLDFIVVDSADETKNRIDIYIKDVKEALEKEKKTLFKGRTPSVSSKGSSTKTKAEILAIKNPELRQKEMLKHRELFGL